MREECRKECAWRRIHQDEYREGERRRREKKEREEEARRRREKKMREEEEIISPAEFAFSKFSIFRELERGQLSLQGVCTRQVQRRSRTDARTQMSAHRCVHTDVRTQMPILTSIELMSNTLY